MRNQKQKFSIPWGVTYLNCAYMAPIPKSVEKAGIAGMKRKRNPAAISPIDFFTQTEELRRQFARLINLNEPQRVVIVPSVSYGMSAVINNIKPHRGDQVIVAAEQFPSNYYPWEKLTSETHSKLLVVGPPPAPKDRGKVWNEKILDNINNRTRVVALGHVHWADGTRFDLVRIRKRTKEVGALLIIDGTQSVGALPFDVKAIEPDALVCGGYKWLMGPYAIGMAYFGKYFDGGKPIEENWINRLDSENFAGLVNYKKEYQPGALRYEVGEHSNFILVPMMLEALKQINQWGPANIQKYCKGISDKFIEELRKKEFFIEDESFRGNHLFGIRFPKEFSIEKLKARMAAKKIFVSFRGDSMRVSPNVYNSKNDFDKLLKCLLKP